MPKWGSMLVLSDDFASEDLVGRNEYRDGLVEVIRSVNALGSFTIGIYGQWGTGKTSMLRQIKKVLDEQPSDAKPLVHTVWFNPWQFVADEHLIIPFFHTLIDSLDRSVNPLEAPPAQMGPLEPRGHAASLVEKIRNIPEAIAYGMTEGQSKMDFLGAMPIPWNSKTLSRNVSGGQTSSVYDAAKAYESIYYNLIQVLRDATRDLDFKVVVFIDDLDRCLPERAVQLLESLKVLLDLPNFVFVIGVARDVIERGVRVRYSDLYRDGTREDLPDIEVEYLDKIIQFPFSLPTPDPEKLKKGILLEQLKKLEGFEGFVDRIFNVLGSNPRTLKRFINVVSFSTSLAERKLKKGNYNPELIVKITLIAYVFPVLYRQLEEYPGHLVLLEGIVRTVEDDRRQRESDPDEPKEARPSVERKTGLPQVDRWLGDRDFARLYSILRTQGDSPVSSSASEHGFRNLETVVQYIRLVTTSLQSEVASKAKGAEKLVAVLDINMADRLVRVPTGTFRMGDDTVGAREVTVTRPFLLDKYPVTQGLYERTVGKNPSYLKGEDLPVVNVSWFEAVEFCNTLSISSHLDPVYEVEGDTVKGIDYSKGGYRLPTEAEWEYACRGKTNGSPYDGATDEIAWYSKNSDMRLQGVGQKKPNSLGLYDMLGNVWEWCNDWYDDYPKVPQTDPEGPGKGYIRVLRGGSWSNFEASIRCTYRQRKDPFVREDNIGFRIARTLPKGRTSA